MIPFRAFDRQKKEMWIVLNYHASKDQYLIAREDDADADGQMKLLTSDELAKLRLIDFLDDWNDNDFHQ